MGFLRIENVVCRYPNGFTAVDDVSMSFESGESVAIIGQNGAGKTTLAKMMNGLLKPTEGNIIVDGWNTREHTTAKLSMKIGYVFQNPDDQIFHNEVYAEIAFGPKNLGASDEEIKRRVEHAAELTNITQYLEEHPYNLPYSMRKFVTIASIIAMNPQIIILDEPTAGQDRTSMDQLRYVIDYLTSQGKTIVTITHDMEFVVNNFERVIVMANKKKIADTHKRDVFWDFDVLKEGMLKQPHISRLARKLNVGNKVLEIDEFISNL